MVSQQTIVTGQGSAPSGSALVGIVFFGFSSGLMQKAADTMCYLLCALSGMLLQRIPEVSLTAMQWFESFALDHGQLLFLLHLLGDVAPLLHWAARVI